MNLNKDNIQTQALDVIKNYIRCGVNISMGVGKTRLALKHYLYINSQVLPDDPITKVLVVIPKLSVIESWKKEMDFLNINKDNFEFTTYLSLIKKEPEDYMAVYLDECHNLLSKHIGFLGNFRGWILGMTGTPPVRTSSIKYKLVNSFCPIVYNYTVDKATDDSILNDYKIYIHKLELSPHNNLTKKKRDGGFWKSSEVKDYNYHTRKVSSSSGKAKQFASIMRMKAMMDYTTKEVYVRRMLNKIKDKVIVFANTQKQADKLCKHSFHSKNKSSEENFQLFCDGRIDQLSCVLQLSEGVNIPNLKQGIIMHAYGNERKTAQRIGRLLRLNPDETAICHILCYKNTVDEKWIGDALKSFDQNKIINYG
jgi:superfamily II DNA or RNA helicase